MLVVAPLQPQVKRSQNERENRDRQHGVGAQDREIDRAGRPHTGEADGAHAGVIGQVRDQETGGRCRRGEHPAPVAFDLEASDCPIRDEEEHGARRVQRRVDRGMDQKR